jgi:large subunit ribosomal protein L30
MADEKQLRITQVRSTIGRTQDQRATVRSLGLKRIRHTVIQPDRPEIRGMLNKVPHLVSFEEAEGAAPRKTAKKAAKKTAKKTAKKSAKKAAAKKSAKKTAKKAGKKTAKKAAS